MDLKPINQIPIKKPLSFLSLIFPSFFPTSLIPSTTSSSPKRTKNPWLGFWRKLEEAWRRRKWSRSSLHSPTLSLSPSPTPSLSLLRRGKTHAQRGVGPVGGGGGVMAKPKLDSSLSCWILKIEGCIKGSCSRVSSSSSKILSFFY